MLFRSTDLERIAAGEVTAAVRRWRRPTVRTGGTLTTPVGVLAIDEVRLVDASDLTEKDALDAGAVSLADLLEDPALRREGTLHLIRFHLAGSDPRIALRDDDRLDDAELDAVTSRLARMDARSTHGAWTTDTLTTIETRPGVRAGDLAASLGRPTQPFKADVRKLKALGLTESLEVGYRLSPRGRRVLAAIRSASASAG